MRSSVWLLLLIVCAVAPAWSQSGKISGRVIDAQTGEPLPGVNVTVEGTVIGTATGTDGYYTILRVPPGQVTVVFSFLGFQRVRVNEVQVGIDRTTNVDAELREEVFEGEEVIVTAERPAVQRDLTGTSTGFTAEQVRTAPVEGVRGVLALTAAINTNPDGTLSVRGSGPYDMQVLVNGMAQTMTSSSVPGYAIEKANNSWKYDFNPLGVGQMEVISGGFSAEYGNAQSGIVKVSTREGTNQFEVEYRTEYRAPGQYHWGRNFYGMDQPEFVRWSNLDNWRAALPDSSDRAILRYYTQWMSNHLPSFNAPDTIFTRTGGILYLPGQEIPNLNGVYDYTAQPYTRHLFGIGGPLTASADLRFHVSGEFRDAPTRIPTIERVQRYRNITATTTYQPSGRHKFRLTNLFQYYHGGLVSGAEDIRWAGRDPSWKYTLTQDSKREEVTSSQTLNYVFAINSTSVFEATGSHAFEQYRVPMFPTVNRTNPWSVPEGVWDEGFRPIFGFTSLYNQDARTRTFSGDVKYTSQVSRGWEFRTGAQWRWWNTVYNGVSSFSPSAFVNRTGFGEFYEAQPWTAALFLQNKLEFEGMVANIGLRLDGYNFGTDVPVDKFDVFYQALEAEAIGNPATRRSISHWRLSPRLGFSFPVGEATAFRLQYGHFSAMPQARVALSRINELGWNFYGNPDLKPERTVNFEVGVQQALLDGTHRLDIVGYYNDRLQQVSTVNIRSTTGSIRRSRFYTSFLNNGYGTSVGTEISFERMDRSPWTYRLSYSLQRTTLGSYGSASLYSDDPDDPRNQLSRKEAFDGLSGNDRTHRLRGLFGYRWGAQGGPEVLGFRPLAGATVNVIYQAQSGAPYTYVTQFDAFQDVRFNRRYPFEESFDLNLNKSIDLPRVAVTVGARIQNLFNHQWLTPKPTQQDIVYWHEQGRIFDTFVRNQPNVGEGREAYFYRNVPRQVFFSLGLRLK